MTQLLLRLANMYCTHTLQLHRLMQPVSQATPSHMCGLRDYSSSCSLVACSLHLVPGHKCSKTCTKMVSGARMSAVSTARDMHTSAPRFAHLCFTAQIIMLICIMILSESKVCSYAQFGTVRVHRGCGV